MRQTARPLLRNVAVAIALATAFQGAFATDSPALQPHDSPVIHSIPGGASVFPESVAVDAASGHFYVGSVKDGTIYKGKLGSARMKVFSPAGADGRVMATGMSYAKGRLVVLGRQTGQIYVYDTNNGSLLSKLDNGLGNRQPFATFLNDTTFAPDGSAYVTDSINPVLYRLAPIAEGKYELQEFLRFEGTPVKYVNAPGAPGINLNGVVATADGRYLIIGKRNENRLFRVDLRTMDVTPVSMHPETLNTPDGLYLHGTTMYVAQNLPKAVGVLKFSADFSQATLVRNIPNPSFAFPTSVARLNDRLLVVSAQFDTVGSPAAVSGTNPPVVPFWISEIAAPSE